MYFSVPVKIHLSYQIFSGKDPWLAHFMVDYCLTNSQRCVEILVGVPEPHHKYLFDR